MLGSGLPEVPTDPSSSSMAHFLFRIVLGCFSDASRSISGAAGVEAGPWMPHSNTRSCTPTRHATIFLKAIGGEGGAQSVRQHRMVALETFCRDVPMIRCKIASAFAPSALPRDNRHGKTVRTIGGVISMSSQRTCDTRCYCLITRVNTVCYYLITRSIRCTTILSHA